MIDREDWRPYAWVIFVLGVLLAVVFLAASTEAKAIAECKVSGGVPVFQKDEVWIVTDQHGGGYFLPLDTYKECDRP